MANDSGKMDIDNKKEPEWMKDMKEREAHMRTAMKYQDMPVNGVYAEPEEERSTLSHRLWLSLR